MVLVVAVLAAGSSILPQRYIPSGGRAELQVLQEVLETSLGGHPVVLYTNPINAPQILALPALRRDARILVNLGADGAAWCQRQPTHILRTAFLVHVVVFSSDPRPLFRGIVASDPRWNPKYLILFSLSRDNFVDILKADEFNRPERTVLFQRWPGNTYKILAGEMELLVYFPFSGEVKSLGLWTSLLTRSAIDIFVDRFPNFEGYRFWLGTWFDDFPYLHQAKGMAEGTGDGLEVEMLLSLAPVLNYTFHLTTKPPDNKWGALENGSWTGMLGMVHRKEKNFTVNYFGYTHERIKAFDASVPYWMEGFGLALLKPQPLAKWRSVLYPFPRELWAAVAVSFTITVVVTYFQDRVETEFVEGSSSSSRPAWLYVLRPMVFQPLPKIPKAQGRRVFAAVWWMGCFILITAYIANLIAFLTIPAYPQRLQTVKELARSSYRVSMYDYGEFVPQALRSSQDPHYRALGSRLDLYRTYDEAIYAVLNGTHAYIENFSYNLILLFNVYKMRNTYLLREQLYPGHLCWYFQKNTAWKYKFDEGIQRLVEAGLIAYWIKNKTEDFMGLDYHRKLQQEAKQTRRVTSLSLQHIQGIFFVLLLGWAICVLLLAKEALRTHISIGNS